MNAAGDAPAVWEAAPEAWTAGDWDAELAGLEGRGLYQGHAWGCYEEALGRRVLRLRARDAAGRTVALLQCTWETRGFCAAARAQGGPAGAISACGPGLLERLRRQLGRPCCYLRLDCQRPRTEGDAALLRGSGWRPAAYRYHSGLSLALDLAAGSERLRAGLGGNWRRNLRRAEGHGLRCEPWPNPDPDSLRALYAETESLKGLPTQYSLAELAAMVRALGDRLVAWKASDGEGRLLAVRACGRAGDHARDLLAAASMAARKTYASHLLLWRLLEDCRGRGVRTYDLGGVDPEGNGGVYDFKKGTGAADLAYLGEWHQARPAPLAPLMDLVLPRLHRRRARTSP